MAGYTNDTSSMQHSKHPCENVPNANTGQYGWMLPEGYGQPSQQPAPAVSPGDLLGFSGGPEMCPSQGLRDSVMDWQSVDACGGQATSMSRKISVEMVPQRHASPPASTYTASCHRSLSSSHGGGESRFVKEEAETVLKDFDPVTDSKPTTEPRVRIHHMHEQLNPRSVKANACSHTAAVYWPAIECQLALVRKTTWRSIDRPRVAEY